MLESSRFTRSITKSTRTRLQSVLDNSRPLTRRERNRGAVVAIQSALADLNQGYLVEAQVDSYYGSRTAEAVEMFQRDYGLAADGIVGRQTLTQLDTMYTGDVYRRPQGMSIHVGVNVVDEDHYGNKVTPLAACVHDAHSFRDVAVTLGYQEIVLADEDATTLNFTAAMRQAAANLFSGDYLFVTFSGHGSQIANNSSDEEADLLDETLCFYDRMLIDDELFALLMEFRSGVNVTLIYDSCHSGTVTRMIRSDEADGDAALNEFREKTRNSIARSFTSFLPEMPRRDENDEDRNAEQDRFVPFSPDKLDEALHGDAVEQPAPRAPKQELVESVIDCIAQTQADIDSGEKKAFDYELTVPRKKRTSNSNLYNAVQSIVGSKEDWQLECAVIALSACQDNQETLDGAANGLFTGNVLAVWDDGGFEGSFQQIYARLLALAESRPNITPALNVYGGPRAEARLYERPFAF